MSDIAIIGGGAAGAAVFGELLNGNDDACIHWITGRAVPGRGVAYATTHERHLLNVRAAGMGVFADHAEGFVQHVARLRPVVRGADFLPRGLFGDFIEAQIRARIDAALQRGRNFVIHDRHAIGVQARDGGGYTVQLSANASIEAGSVVLAVGALKPRPLSTVHADALASDAFVTDPWSLQARNPAPRRVLVIGTGLTAVDSLLSVSDLWPHAELIAVSRHAQMPFAHPSLPRDPYPHQLELNEALLVCNGVAPMLRRIREALRDEPGVDWRSVVDGMRSINALLWQGLDVRQRRQFMRHVRWIWEASRHRTAPASHEAIEQLRESGRLQIHAARVLGVRGAGPLEITLRSRANQLVQRIEADLVIQATGLDTAVAYADDPLLSSLLGDGLAVPDALQLGLSASADGELLGATGSVQPKLYAIGSLLRGNFWECTAMPEIRAAAHMLARRITQSDRPRRDSRGALGGNS